MVLRSGAETQISLAQCPRQMYWMISSQNKKSQMDTSGPISLEFTFRRTGAQTTADVSTVFCEAARSVLTDPDGKETCIKRSHHKRKIQQPTDTNATATTAAQEKGSDGKAAESTDEVSIYPTGESDDDDDARPVSPLKRLRVKY